MVHKITLTLPLTVIAKTVFIDRMKLNQRDNDLI